MRVFNNIKYHRQDSELLSDNSNLKSIILRTEQSNNQFSNTNSIYLRIFTSNEKTFFISAIGWYENPKLHAYFAEYLMHSTGAGWIRLLRNTIHEF